jgi:hypothetical protein
VEVGGGRRTNVLAILIKVKKLLCCIPKGKGAHLFIVDPNLSHGFEPSIHDIVYKTKLEMRSQCKGKKNNL